MALLSLAHVSLPHPLAPTYDARDLLGPGGEARLVLDGQVYTLRMTRAGKLILTK
ncbi:MAG: hypothetical protein AVDCRST_MAG15-765 [uncultured Rubellimicrobium sp.]|uniref:Hemin uptake protein HemP n=1 Tax=uncultured Rubellimicrobium sp. TaxID=543078 RepID=A0A6J4NS42_9RHOB|nr:MAG: hypothetical protein AVDCRST_MAG15-765 [uncultured Rubellimicrobium sp.]